jgi:hypothetical protein
MVKFVPHSKHASSQLENGGVHGAEPFHEILILSVELCEHLLYRSVSRLDQKNVENTGTNSFTPVSKV